MIPFHDWSVRWRPRLGRTVLTKSLVTFGVLDAFSVHRTGVTVRWATLPVRTSSSSVAPDGAMRRRSVVARRLGATIWGTR
jgi:hypothetical protein